MPTMNKNPQATMTIRQGEAQYGTPEPQIEIRFPKGAHHRQVSAAVHKLAAESSWPRLSMSVGSLRPRPCTKAVAGCTWKLAGGTPAEAERGMAMLKKLAKQGRQTGDATGSLSHG